VGGDKSGKEMTHRMFTSKAEKAFSTLLGISKIHGIFENNSLLGLFGQNMKKPSHFISFSVFTGTGS